MDNWKRKFEARILARGKAYFNEKRAEKIESSASGETAEYKAKVSGSKEYDVTITIRDGEITDMSCTCPYYAEKEEPCKHMAAVLFQLEAQGAIPYVDDYYSTEKIVSELKEELFAEGHITDEQIDRAIKSWQEDYIVTMEDNRAEMFAAAEEIIKEENERKSAGEEQESLEKLLEELDNLVGLDVVKKDIKTMINFVRVNKVRKDRGLKTAAMSYHLVFSGNPGTGKTTVARLLAKIYKQIGLLPEGHLVEVDRSDLVGGYLGQTAIKTSEVVENAIGGVLFIDEAYSLTQDEQDSYGKECIATILKAMEDYRDELIVIVAGYDELMYKFIESNPGLRSRFNKYFHFPDYSGEEMEKIFLLQCKNNGYQLDENAQAMLRAHFENMYENRDDNFGNGRDVRNIFEKIINAQANRLAEDQDLTDDELVVLTAEDVQSVIGFRE